MSKPNVRQNIKTYIKEGRKTPTGRYTSFDYCYNYFYSFRKKPEKLASKTNIEKSCLQLGFFLASWGMYRGSTTVLSKSVKHFEALIKTVIAREDSKIYWKIDVNEYNDKNIQLLLVLKEKIEDALGNNPSDTLVTKIMLGIFGNTPAFDVNFKKGMRRYKYGVYKFKEQSLKTISKFYEHHTKALSSRIPTFKFSNGQKTNIMYTKAKLVDMAAFQAGRS